VARKYKQETYMVEQGGGCGKWLIVLAIIIIILMVV
jgi:hypothetical protein